jgi:hypothetical protein
MIASSVDILIRILPPELIGCLRASFQKEETFLSAIPSLVEKGFAHKIEKRGCRISAGFEQQCKITIASVPDDAIVNIFSFLDCHTLLSLSKTCHQFYHASHDYFIWKPYLEIMNSRKITMELRDKMNLFYIKSPEEKMYDGWKNTQVGEVVDDETSQIGGDEEEDENTSLSGTHDDDEETSRVTSTQFRQNLLFEWKAPQIKPKLVLTPYLEFRGQKLQIPFIRRRLIRVYGETLKLSYLKYTKWINLIKACTVTLYTLFLAMLTIKLDDLIPWPWPLIYFPLAVGCIPQIVLVILFWLPSLNWPLLYYRWIFQDYVGCWSSWAYCMTLKGRFIQLIFGVTFTLGFLLGFFSTLFPTVVPSWSPLVLCGAGFLFWTTSVTQLKYPQRRWFYIIVMAMITLGLTAFSCLIFVKIYFFPTTMPWSVAFIPFYIVSLCFTALMIKANIDMNTSSLFLHALIWNLQFIGCQVIFTTGLLFVVLKLDSVFNYPWAITCIPFFVMMLFLNVFYYMKAMTNWVKRPVLKNPFTWIGQGTKNTQEMNKYVV